MFRFLTNYLQGENINETYFIYMYVICFLSEEDSLGVET